MSFYSKHGGWSFWLFGWALLAHISTGHAQPTGLRSAELTREPGWESFRSRLLSPSPRRVRQDFGWREGRVGGWIQRSLTPASFLLPIPPRSLNVPLHAAGKFSVREDDGSSGLLFGFFHETSRGWRTPNSLAFRLDGNTAKYWVFYEYGTRNGRTGCEGCFQGDRYQTTPTPPFRADGSEHAWTLAYQPRPTGDGLLTFTLDGTARTIVVPAEHRNDGAEFNRFGLINQQASGSGMEVWFSELSLEHQKLELSQPGTWIGSGNKVEFVDRADRPFHDFHWSATNRMGGKDGEIGGVIWRDEKPAYYADRVGPLTLQNELFASGRVTMHSAGADSALFLGWFDSASKTNKTTPEISEPQPNLLGILIEGPSSVGHYFRPMWRSSGKLGHLQDSGAIIKPDGQPHRWSFHYQPRDASGQGTITVTLDAASQTVPVPAEHQAAGARFDRFGIGNLQVGGLHIDFSLDDLRYTAQPR